jgi:hypothetical protein
MVAARRIAVRVPDTPGTRGPGLAFEPGVELLAGATDRDRLLALLGRSPAWRGLDQKSARTGLRYCARPIRAGLTR